MAGKSLNNRTYPREVLQAAAPLYEGKPFILDHDIEHAERVVGIIGNPRYATERGANGPTEGLWVDAVGLMDENLFAKLSGSRGVPPLVRGVSIGGEGEGDWQSDGGVLIKSFRPAELSVTAFPGIPSAHIAAINMFRESLIQKYQMKKIDQMKKMNSINEVGEAEVSLEEAEEQAAKTRERTNSPWLRGTIEGASHRVREGPLPGPDSAASTRSIRGVQWAKNDSRPGLPAPTVRTPVVHIQPQATTSSDSGILGNGSGMPGGIAPASSATGAAAAAGYTTTMTPGYGKLSKSGSGLPEQEAAPGTAADAGAMGSKDAKVFKPKTPKTGHTTTKTPGYGKLSPSGTGIDDQPEEESVASKDDDNPHPRKTDRTMTKNPSIGKSGTNPHDKNEEEEESQQLRVRNVAADADSEEEEEESPEEEEEEEHGPSPHIPGKPVGKKSPHSADNAYDSPADSEEEESMQIKQDDEPVGVTKKMKPATGDEEEGDGIDVDPVRKTAGQGQNVGANPTSEMPEEEERYTWTDANPEGIKASVYSLPADSNITKAMLRANGILNPNAEHDEQQNAAIKQNLEFWNKMRNPPAPKPKKVTVKLAGRDPYARTPIPTIKPTLSPVSETIRTKTQTSLASGTPAIQISATGNTLDEDWQKLGEAARKEWNGGRKLFLKQVPRLLGVRYSQ